MKDQGDEQDLKEMIRRYVEGKATDSERQFLEQYYAHFEDKSDVLDSLSQEQQDALGWVMADHISENITHSHEVLPFWRNSWFSAAASVLLMLGMVGGLFWMSKTEKNPIVSQVRLPADFEPGTNVAVLTLSDGRQVVLEGKQNGTIAKQGEVDILKREDGLIEYDMRGLGETGKRVDKPTINRIATPAGGQYRIVLPDGTKVWLNALSSIQFPTFFAGKIRKVQITGECYFDVAENKDLPFVVNINDREEVRVTGTAFNISAYSNDKEIRTTLVEGAVKVGVIGGSETTVLKPGEQAVINKGGNYQVSKVNISQAIAWKFGLFQFHDSSLESVMNQIARWYNVEVVYENGIPQKTFTGKIHRNVNASQILDIIKFAGVNFQLEPTKVDGLKGRIVVTP